MKHFFKQNTLTMLVLAVFAISGIGQAHATIYTYQDSNVNTSAIVGNVNEKTIQYNDITEDFSLSFNVSNPTQMSTLATHGWLTLYPNGDENAAPATLYFDFATNDVFVYDAMGNNTTPDQENHIATYANSLSVIQQDGGFSVSFNMNVADINNDLNWAGLGISEEVQGTINLSQLNSYATSGQGSEMFISDWKVANSGAFCSGRVCQASVQYNITKGFGGVAESNSVAVSEPIGFAAFGLFAIGFLARRRLQK